MNQPIVSILIPVRNESAYIKRCLDAVLSQDYPTDLTEILIADGVSTDTTQEIIQEFQKKHSNIHFFDNDQKIVSTGLNTLIRESKGDILIRVDGHTVISPDYVQKCVELLENTTADNVGGCMRAKGENFIGKAIGFVTSSPFGIGGSRFHHSTREEWVDTVYMGAWKRETFRTIGLFDEELIRDQDDEFNYRLRKFGGRILLSPKINSIYTPRSSLRKLWTQYYQYGYWKVRVLQKHPRQMSLRQFIPPTFILSLFLSILLSLIFQRGWMILLSLIGSYLFANLIASLLLAGRKGWNYFVLLPISFSTIHISYGLGFLWGLIKFWNRWGDKVGKVPVLKVS